MACPPGRSMPKKISYVPLFMHGCIAAQTLKRVRETYKPFIQADQVQVFDIMSLPENLTPYELSQRLILVVKKEDDNLRRLLDAFVKKYPVLQQKRLLIVDDEAD